MTRLLTLAAALLLLPGVALAQQMQCADHAGILAALAQRYSESIRGAGITLGGSLLEITVAPTGTWTIIATRPGGLGCIVTMGSGWQFIAAPTFKRDL